MANDVKYLSSAYLPSIYPLWHFMLLWSNTWEKRFKGRKISFGPWFQSILGWIHRFEPEVRQNIMAVGAGGRCCLLIAASKRIGRCGDKLYTGNLPSETHFPNETPPPLHHLPVMSSDYESIKGLNHWWSQNPQGPITSPKVPALNIAGLGVKPFWGIAHIQTVNNLPYLLPVLKWDHLFLLSSLRVPFVRFAHIFLLIWICFFMLSHDLSQRKTLLIFEKPQLNQTFFYEWSFWSQV
jgi:hypothetical protein